MTEPLMTPTLVTPHNLQGRQARKEKQEAFRTDSRALMMTHLFFQQARRAVGK